MPDETGKIDEIKASVEQLRDEIKLEAHLAKAEAAEELEKLDRKWNSFLEEYKSVAKEAGKTAGNAGTALGLLADELKEGYERIRKLF